MRRLMTGALLLTLTGCAAGLPQRPTAATARACPDGAAGIATPPGKAWWAENRWRFATDDAATAAYDALLKGASPWPDWMGPTATVLPVGTRFQMALGVGQPADRPGGFGTFDLIRRVADVRDALAVRYEWKPDIDRVVTYEVVEPLPVKVGPIGPQVDPKLCRILPGRWSQFEMAVPPPERAKHLKVVEIRPIK